MAPLFLKELGAKSLDVPIVKVQRNDILQLLGHAFCRCRLRKERGAASTNLLFGVTKKQLAEGRTLRIFGKVLSKLE